MQSIDGGMETSVGMAVSFPAPPAVTSRAHFRSESCAWVRHFSFSGVIACISSGDSLAALS